jgi:hypothetical protein
VEAVVFGRKPGERGAAVLALVVAIGCSASGGKPQTDGGTGGGNAGAGAGSGGTGGGAAGSTGGTGTGGATGSAGAGGGPAGSGGTGAGGGAGRGGAGRGGAGGGGSGGSAGGGMCGDTSSDWQNCGACGHACNNGGQCPNLVGAACCAAGKCAPGWGPCFTEASGFTSCDDACASIGETCAADQCGQTTTNGYTLIGWTAENAANCPLRQSPDYTPHNFACDTKWSWLALPPNIRCCCTNMH